MGNIPATRGAPYCYLFCSIVRVKNEPNLTYISPYHRTKGRIFSGKLLKFLIVSECYYLGSHCDFFPYFGHGPLSIGFICNVLRLYYEKGELSWFLYQSES